MSRRYVLAVEYHAHETTEVPYRRQRGALLKRNYAKLYRELFPELEPFDQGFLGRDEGWDRRNVVSVPASLTSSLRLAASRGAISLEREASRRH